MSKIMARIIRSVAAIFNPKNETVDKMFTPNGASSLYCPPPPCFEDICCSPVMTTSQEAYRRTPVYVRIDCGNAYDNWRAPAKVPANRAERRDRNFGVTTNRDGSIKLPPPNYVALQPKRLDRVR
jgi:hypothetical protein